MTRFSRRGLLSLGAGLGVTFLAAPVLADPLSAAASWW